MSIPYAEVIGDPIAQSKSPLIHKHWLAALALEGDFRAIHVLPAELAEYLARRRVDPSWRGCSVTLPHKQAVLPLLDHVEPSAADIGAINCIVRGAGGLTGRNTDIDGVAAALAGVPLAGGKAALIGAGGAARAAIRCLLDSGASIDILARDPEKAAHFAGERVRILPLGGCDEGFEGASAIVNASPLGMAGADEMPDRLLAAVARHAAGKTVFDMVYKPLETSFLAAARAHGGESVDGLVMLVGQARAAFQAFFGRPAPIEDEALRGLLAT